MPFSSTALSFDKPQSIIERIIHNVEKVLVGKREAIEHVTVALLCGGHVLLEDVPGVGKTMLVKAVARTVGATFKRIQFTPDMLPSDVTGVAMYNQKTADFEFRQGPIMANIVLADELNRASPKTQAALLEAMEEQSVTVDGTTYPLPQPFLLLATQNPAEYEGTFLLPEAQLDRFLLKLRLGYPEPAQEVDMLGRIQEKHPIDSVTTVLMQEELVKLQHQVRSVFVDETLKQYIVVLTHATRKHEDVALGASPRSSIALMKAAQAKAFMSGRGYVIPDDIKQLLVPVLAHRLIIRSDAKWSGKSSASILQQIASQTAVPDLNYNAGQAL